ncbi:uroporphyrinogen-III C-methyltransferase [Abyssalbus ytuae]|uniref:uroporphyrinogen-III C-methyltransferase n=1 Tax=Abyssalbus ytuae TaxID=2926907 RepID=A0A9E6ZYX3_9FLAO|nr:uroporphyrinogen-III C-methyltransferase [Abyssalbus ytuae]UOB19516.1 uroporphyrinogen-III C-methyltransferase [Abyssalbus ytuae]
MKEKKTPKLTLVGAGPGDPELLTLKAIKALNEAQVVLYDALANEEILQHAPYAEKLFVGKRKGCHACTQEEINKLIVQKALQKGHVVRLKGGDPFVFGRGSEEIEYAESFDIATEVIPGITSAIAVPGSKGISVTKRKVAESFWVITGTTSNHKLSKDVELAARSTATVVILMGMGKLPEIVSIFKKYGKSSTPVAIIQNGTRKNAKHGFGTINTIEKVVEEEQLSSPAIIVIGEVVRHSSKLLEYFEDEFFEDEFLFQNLDIVPNFSN